MGVASIIGVTSVTMSLHSIGYTTSTRAGVQAEAAAEAGIDFAAASLATSVCQPVYTNSTAPVFSVLISYSTLASSPGDVDTSWVSGCPTTTSAARLKLVSTGWASQYGVAGNSSNDARMVEAIYPYTPTPPSYVITPSGASLYAYAQLDPTINNLTITQASTERPSVQYYSGSVTCTSGTVIQGDVILGGGDLSVTSGCTINGDLWASGAISISSGEVTGNVVTDNTSTGVGQYALTLSSSSTIDGNVFSSGGVNIGGKVGGNVVAGPNALSSTFANHSSVGGSVVTSGSVTAPAGIIQGTTTTNQAGIVTPVIPAAPPWIDFAYNPADWKTSTGAPFTVLTMSTCSSADLQNALNAAQASTNPMIVDTRACGSDTDLRGIPLSLHSDLVIITNSFTMSANNIQSSDGVDKRFWIIIPDAVLDRLPTCLNNASPSIGQNVTINTHVGAMVYSPCEVSNSGDVWRGQMYASSVATSSNFVLEYIPIGLPTVNLSTGQFLAPPGTGVLGGRTSIRDLAM
ncbi:MAG TPA: polymer-forming cytoskeletal protein [Candidatus Paceibacterota bacterium]|nr:polymer-forming cytoskeletal protein [Candidatus Paceibacterota bacterium]